MHMHMHTHGTLRMVTQTRKTTNFQGRISFYIGKQAYSLLKLFSVSLGVRFFSTSFIGLHILVVLNSFVSKLPWLQVNTSYKFCLLCTPSSAELVNVIIIIIIVIVKTNQQNN